MSMHEQLLQNVDEFKPTNLPEQQSFQKTSWTLDRVDRLRQLWNADKSSASQCAAILNAEFPELARLSRNAVIGKTHRLQLVSRPAIQTGAYGGKQNSRRRELKRISPSQAVFEIPKQQTQIARETSPDLFPLEQRKTFEQLKLGFLECRWPVGTVGHAEFFFCGAILSPDRDNDRPPYCPECYKRSVRQ